MHSPDSKGVGVHVEHGSSPTDYRIAQRMSDWVQARGGSVTISFGLYRREYTLPTVADAVEFKLVWADELASMLEAHKVLMAKANALASKIALGVQP